MVIWPLVNGPAQEFVPLYLAVIVIAAPSMCAVPVACAEHVPDIIDPTGMSIVNVMS